MLACVLALVGAIAASAGEPSDPAPTIPTTAPPAGPELTWRDVQPRIDEYRHRTWHWQRVMSKPLTAGSRAYRTDPSLRYRRWVRNLWRERAIRARRRALNPPYRSVWLCIHRYEASWHDAGSPYYGGLQMDISFQLHYGRRLYRVKGTAENWTPLEQIWVAEKARRSGRGFSPWPHTARLCGAL